MRPLLFLDFDGVIMTAGSYERAARTPGGLSPSERIDFQARSRMDRTLVGNASALCKAKGANIVLSTSWRGSGQEDRERMEAALWDCGLDSQIVVVGQTPHLPERAESGLWLGRSRGAEIVAWLDKHRPGWSPEDVLILDDDSDMDPLKARWVECNWIEGFDARRLDEALTLWRVR